MIMQDAFIHIWMEDLTIQNHIRNRGESAVDHLNLRINSGEYVCISGLYGTDKISFINTLSCLSRADGGKYIYNYMDTTTIEQEKLDFIRSGIGFLFKDLIIIEELTVYQNIELPIQQNSEIERLHIINLAERFGLNNVLHAPAKKLSELEKHKVALARALAVKPIFVIADEPAMNLKQQDEKMILDMLHEINKQGITVICFSEREQVVERVNRHLVFENGQMKSDKQVLSCYLEEGAV
jgi:putative ABC transport system ATP-binding protein